jgi:putative membrane protein
MKTLFSLLFLLILGIPAAAVTEQPRSDTGARARMAAPAKPALPKSDLKFVNEAAHGGLAEVKLGNLAVQRGQSQEVRDFGNLMVRDHSRINDDLRAVAQKKGVALPQNVGKQQRQQFDQLKKEPAERFDQAYMRVMQKDHENDIAAFEKFTKNTKDTELKDFAENSLRTFHRHLDEANRVAGDLR